VNAAVECGFYDVVLNGRQLSAELWLSDSIEGPVVSVIRTLADDPESLLNMNQMEQWLLARFLVAQRFRAPAFRAFMERTMRQVQNQIAGAVSAALERDVTPANLPHLVRGMEAPVVSEGADASLSMLGEVDGFANLLLYKEWRIGRVVGKQRLYTSDNPVAAYLQAIRPPWARVGAAFAEFQYYFALSPNVLFGSQGRIMRRTSM
jgi:hypothetical protein